MKNSHIIRRIYTLKTVWQNLNFETINGKIDEIMKENRYKKLIIVEPKPNFISDLEQEFFNYKNNDEFKIKEFRNNIIKKIIKHGVNISQNDIKITLA